jgi:GDP-mannose pyrophosphatase NudK
MSKVIIREKKILSDNWYKLYKLNFERVNSKGECINTSREAYDRGNGAAILPYDPLNKKVILTSQFRIPTFLNGNKTGMLIEACAGLLDKDDPISCIKREAEEETGYRLTEVTKIFEAYMSPGSVTEILYFFIAAYDSSMKINNGGGIDEEHEDIEVLELLFDEAYSMIHSGEIKDGKTIMLLQYLKLNLFK